ncbi:MAG: class I SAM-dependent methyltransferase [Candidatus Omnitrophica bacterium]|nr:class I SAM-dependent methyltransferase [Candidatus Omnitrophota bacterium]
MQKLFESWGDTAKGEYIDQQWLLSKWEVVEGVVWPIEKINLMTQTIVDGIELKKTDTLADLGCGGGWILKQLKPYSKSVVGLDFSQSMLRKAVEFCPSEKLVCGEIGRLPFHEASFDCAISYFVFLNFLDDDFVEQGLIDVLRILKRGGRALIGQLPDQSRSQDYDRAKSEYFAYCAKTFKLGESHREVCQAPQKLFDIEKLRNFLQREGITYELKKSFNPFYCPGAEPVVDWRFDLVLHKT